MKRVWQEKQRSTVESKWIDSCEKRLNKKDTGLPEDDQCLEKWIQLHILDGEGLTIKRDLIIK